PPPWTNTSTGAPSVSALRNTSSRCRSCSPYSRSRVTSTAGSLPLAIAANSWVVPPSMAGERSRPRASSCARSSGVMGISIDQQHRLDRLPGMGVGEGPGDLGEWVERQQAVEGKVAPPPEFDQLGNEQTRVGVAAEDAAQLPAPGEHGEHLRLPRPAGRGDEAGGAVHRQAFERPRMDRGHGGGVEAEIDPAAGDRADLAGNVVLDRQDR